MEGSRNLLKKEKLKNLRSEKHKSRYNPIQQRHEIYGMDAGTSNEKYTSEETDDVP